MTHEHPIEKLVHDSVDHLIKENTDHSWGEAIAIIIANMKDKDGLFMMPRFADDYVEHLRLCIFLASALRMYIDANILASIPTKIKKKEWQCLTDEEIALLDKSIDGNIPLEQGKLEFARAIEQALLEKNT
jgi:hypothetical protein